MAACCESEPSSLQASQTPAHIPASCFLFGLGFFFLFFFKEYLNVVHLAPGTPLSQPHS